MNPNHQPIVPRSLRRWFIIHFVVDVLVALPLIVAPHWFLASLGFEVGSTVPARLLGAALFAIGAFSFLMRNTGVEAYRLFLSFKILWSATAIFTLLVALIAGAPAVTWLTVLIFVIFLAVWVSHQRKMNQ